MGCFFSKKSRRKSPKKDSALPDGDESATGNDLPESNNTALGSNSNQEAPKQYSWDKREKVTLRRCILTRFCVLDCTTQCCIIVLGMLQNELQPESVRNSYCLCMCVSSIRIVKTILCSSQRASDGFGPSCVVFLSVFFCCLRLTIDTSVSRRAVIGFQMLW